MRNYVRLGTRFIYLATEAHGITRKKSFKVFILPCFSVCFRGNNIRLYQIEVVEAERHAGSLLRLLHADRRLRDAYPGRRRDRVARRWKPGFCPVFGQESNGQAAHGSDENRLR